MFLMIQLFGAEDTRRLAGMNSPYFYQEYCFAHLSGRPAGCSPEDAAALLYPEEEAEEVASLLEKGREAAEIVTDATARKIIAMDPKVLACSSIYAQLSASLAICRRVKEMRPDIRTVIGGFIHAERGTRILRNYSSVDYVSLGEGDESIAEENPVYEMPGMRQAKLAEKSADNRKEQGGGLTNAEQTDEILFHPFSPDHHADNLWNRCRGTGKAENGSS